MRYCISTDKTDDPDIISIIKNDELCHKTMNSNSNASRAKSIGCKIQ